MFFGSKPADEKEKHIADLISVFPSCKVLDSSRFVKYTADLWDLVRLCGETGHELTDPPAFSSFCRPEAAMPPFLSPTVHLFGDFVRMPRAGPHSSTRCTCP